MLSAKASEGPRFARAVLSGLWLRNDCRHPTQTLSMVYVTRTVEHGKAAASQHEARCGRFRSSEAGQRCGQPDQEVLKPAPGRHVTLQAVDLKVGLRHPLASLVVSHLALPHHGVIVSRVVQVDDSHLPLTDRHVSPSR